MISVLKSKWREYVLLVISIVTTLVISEYGLRYLLFSDISIAQSLRDPGLFANNNYDDDYWKLWVILDPNTRLISKNQLHPKRFDPKLGYVNSEVSEKNYVHRDAKKINGKIPVLLYGDSYAECNVPEKNCFQGILNSNPDFADQYYLINYGVGGYGLDQIYLLYKESINNYENPVVIFSLLEHDMDRTILKFRQVPKPYFEVIGGQLMLQGVPIERFTDDYLLRHPPEINCYLWRLFTRGFLPIPWSEFKAAKKKTISKAILVEVNEDLKARNLRHLFFVFQGIKAPGRTLSWREEFLTNLFDEHKMEYLLTQGILEQRVNESDFDKRHYVISKDDDHPNRTFNLLVTEAILKWLKKESSIIDSE